MLTLRCTVALQRQGAAQGKRHMSSRTQKKMGSEENGPKKKKTHLHGPEQQQEAFHSGQHLCVM